MSQKTRNQLYTEINSGITDALNQQITPAIVRNILTDMVDSGINISDGATASTIFGSPGAINNGTGTVILSSPGSVITFGVTNSAIIGGNGITLTQSGVIVIGGTIINASQSLSNILVNGNDTGPNAILMGTGSSLIGFDGYTSIALNNAVESGATCSVGMSAFDVANNIFTACVIDPTLTNGNELSSNDVTFFNSKYSKLIQVPNRTSLLTSDEFGANTYFNSVDVGSSFVKVAATDPSTGSASTIFLNPTGDINVSAPAGVVLNSQTAIKSSNGGGQINLDQFSSPGEVLISTDNGNQAESYLYMTPTYAEFRGGSGGTIQLNGLIALGSGNSDFISFRTGTGGLRIDGRYANAGSQDIIKFFDNASTPYITNNAKKPSVSIASSFTTINAGVTNSVALGGHNLIVATSNTVYVPNLSAVADNQIDMTVSGSGYTNSTISSNLNTTQNINGPVSTSAVTNDHGGYTIQNILNDNSANAYIQMARPGYDRNQVLILSITDTTYTNGNSNGVSESFDNVIGYSRTIKSYYNYLYNKSFDMYETAQFTQTTGNTLTTIGTFSMANNSVYGVKCKVIGKKTDNTKGYTANLSASFRNNAGTITQIASTVKTEVSEFSTATSNISFSGSNIIVTVTGESATNIDWKVLVEQIH